MGRPGAHRRGCSVRHTPLRLFSLTALGGVRHRLLGPRPLVDDRRAGRAACRSRSAASSGSRLAYRRDPNARSNETWRRLYILYAGLTGIAYGGGGALLFQSALCRAAAADRRLRWPLTAALAPGRIYEPRSYIAFAGFDL